jgi:hypothetical protein
MASSGKRKTTMAKLNRETKLREKRAAKEVRKVQRKREGCDPGPMPEQYPSTAV